MKVPASTYNIDGTSKSTDKQPFNFKNIGPKSVKIFGTSIIRHGMKYEESTLFQGKESYPAKRNWWPLSSDVYEEILPSIADGYPYQAKIAFSYMGAPTYSLPAGQTQIAALLDLDKLPLYIASDILIGPTSMYADYIIPDLHYLERWEFQGSHPNMPVKVQPIRQPVIASPNEIVKVFGEEQPISYETFWLALAEKLGLKGFGKDGFGAGQDFTRPDDFYIRMVANTALDGKDPVTNATPAEIELFKLSRRHLPKNVCDIERWQAISGPAWPKVVTVLNRGGRFGSQASTYKEDQVANKYGKLINLYQEKTGDLVKVVSATNPDGVWDLKKGRRKPMVGKVQVTETIKPGVITFTLGHGHWSAGAEDVTIDGKVIPADTRRAAGVHANAAMWIDPNLKNTCMIDKVGGSVSFYDTMVQLIKV